ncbi:MAG TPA: hypothetical protein VGU68_17910 [Ktedonobacteraceae bacterium]|nr:hypothetical protein [Ktedonobacteraceae bacterium]
MIKSQGGVRGVPATSTPLPPPVVLTERQRTPCMLTERQLAAQQRCQNVLHVPEAAREKKT